MDGRDENGQPIRTSNGILGKKLGDDIGSMAVYYAKAV